MTRPYLFALFVLVALIGQAQAGAQTADMPALKAGRVNGSVVIDGSLDEADWAQADVIEGLTMVEPQEGVPSSMATRIRVLANAQSIAFGIECADPNPAAIVSFTTQRDGDLSSQDYLQLVLGPSLDGRSGYAFAVNPSGARWDAIIRTEGDEQNDEWDGIWEAATRRNGQGWVAEIRIPMTTLSFGRGLTTWHFNVERRIERLQEVARWASAHRDFHVAQTSRAGYLTGLPLFDLGMGLTLRPALVGGGTKTGSGAPIAGELDPSLDLTQRLGSNLLASVTANTDFAETEVDQRRTNLTRFPLFFPEKRSFFLAGSDIFEFGLGLGEQVIPYFSRRIGLVDAREVPLVAGAKVSGRAGSTNLGAQVVRTGGASLPSRQVPAATTGVARVSQNVGRESRIGVIAIAGDPLGRDGRWTVGGDLTYRSSSFRGDKNLIAGAWGLLTDRAVTGGNRDAWGVQLNFPNDRWNVDAGFKDIGEDFNPALGFVPRAGIRRYDGGVTFAPRPGHGIRRMVFELFPSVVTDLDNRWESYQVFVGPLNGNLDSGDEFEVNVVPTGERLVAPFEIEDDVIIAPGTYQWRRYEIELESAAKRRLSVDSEVSFGSFYDGKLNQLSVELAWNPAPLITVETFTELAVARLPAGRFSETVFGTRVRINASPDLSISTFVQYDNVSESLGSNTRLRWTFDPRGDFFIVYNHNVRDRLTRWRFESNQLLMKMQYALPF